MTRLTLSEGTMKISRSFRERLNRLDPATPVRVLVSLRVPRPEPAKQHLRRVQRKKSIRQIQHHLSKPLEHIGTIVENNSGRFTNSNVGPLGTIGIEVPVGALHEIAQLDSVQAIIEDQDVMMIH